MIEYLYHKAAPQTPPLPPRRVLASPEEEQLDREM